MSWNPLANTPYPSSVESLRKLVGSLLGGVTLEAPSEVPLPKRPVYSPAVTPAGAEQGSMMEREVGPHPRDREAAEAMFHIRKRIDAREENWKNYPAMRPGGRE